MIQTSVRGDRGEVIELDHNDPRYWEGAYRYVPYPKALYRVTQPGQKEAECRIVQNEREHQAMGSAWQESPDEAKAQFSALEADVARAAAESNYADRGLSESAKAERLAHERSTDEMVTDVPAPKKRGRPFKTAPPATTVSE